MAGPPSQRPDAPKPSRSGADTSRTTPLIAHGGKIDPEAVRKAVAEQRAGVAEGGPANPAFSLPEDADRQAGSPEDIGEDDAPTRVVFVLQRDLQKRLDKYLVDRITFMSRTQLQKLIDEGGVSVNGRPGKASTKLRLGDRVEVLVPPPPSSEVPPEDIPLEVLFEDEHLIVLNKSPDIIVHPARSHLSGTLINALAFHFQNRSSSGGALSGVGREFARPGVVHRLDRQTSGLIVFAKSDEAHWRLGKQFEQRTVDKRYLALTHGQVEPMVDVIDLPLGPHPSKEKGYREKYVVRHDVLGRPSITIARVRQHFRLGGMSPDGTGPAGRKFDGPADLRRGFTLVELELKTGRTHQIRVHLSHTGYPIVGDDMYGGKALSRGDLGFKTDSEVLIGRQALHAAMLAFEHPILRTPMRFIAPLPSDLRRSLEALRRMDPGSPLVQPPGATIELDTL